MDEAALGFARFRVYSLDPWFVTYSFVRTDLWRQAVVLDTARL